MVENPPANAGDTGSSPGLGRSHMPQSGWAREPQLLSLRVWSLCSATREAAIARGPRTAMKSGPRLPQLEKALAQKRRPNTAINKINLKKKKRWLAGHQSRFFLKKIILSNKTLETFSLKTRNKKKMLTIITTILHCTRVLASALRKEGKEGRRREEGKVGRKEERKAGKH